MLPGFTWDGHHSSDMGVVLQQRGPTLLPDTRDTDIVIPGRPGVYDFGTELGERSLSLELWIGADDRAALAEKLRRLAQTFDPSAGYRALVFDDDPEREYRVKVTGQTPLQYGPTWTTLSVHLKMADPFIYATSDTVEQLVLAVGESGTVENVGTAWTPMILEIEPVPLGVPATPAAGLGTAYMSYLESGALLDPKVWIEQQLFRWNGVIEQGETLVVDTGDMTVRLDGKNVLSGWAGTFPPLLPGANVVTYDDGSGGSARLTFRFRERWL